MRARLWPALPQARRVRPEPARRSAAAGPVLQPGARAQRWAVERALQLQPPELAPQLGAPVQRRAAAVEAAAPAPPAEPELQGLEQPVWIPLSSGTPELAERSRTRTG
ncbi:MAG: hypothetical protein HY527_15555 [Betaproteobacteria bacterium]|nr:hypothetical protein [Betaproteobacteria bacterium]